jgi:hypothetical protein
MHLLHLQTQRLPHSYAGFVEQRHQQTVAYVVPGIVARIASTCFSVRGGGWRSLMGMVSNLAVGSALEWESLG